jgi:hypothetical protein
VIAGMLCWATSSFSAEWFESEAANCSGIQDLGAAITAITGASIPVKSSAPGKYYTTLTGTQLTTSTETISNVKQLDDATSQSLRTNFKNSASNIQVPLLVNWGAAIFAGFLPPVSGTANGVLFSYLLSQMDAIANAVATAGMFIAKGGDVYQRTVVKQRQSDKNLFVATTSEYHVKLGDEARTIPVFGCLYAADVLINEFDTSGPLNNKIMKPIGSNKWRQWDVDSGGFEGDPYTYTYQAGGFYYFELPAIENDQVVGQDLYRISFLGGPWQFMHYDERPNGNFHTLYPNVVAK